MHHTIFCVLENTILLSKKLIYLWLILLDRVFRQLVPLVLALDSMMFNSEHTLHIVLFQIYLWISLLIRNILKNLSVCYTYIHTTYLKGYIYTYEVILVEKKYGSCINTIVCLPIISSINRHFNSSKKAVIKIPLITI